MIHRTRFRIFIGLLALFLSVRFFDSEVLAAPERTTERFRLGVGLGIAYGALIGFNLEVMPVDYLALSGSFGTGGLKGFSWNAGARIYPLKKDRAVNPRLAGYLGKLGDASKRGREPETIVLRGYAFGPGVDFKLKTGLSIDFELLYLKSSGFERLEKNSAWSFSLGIGTPF